jgi:NADH-quinone oxidoreductase subunit N
MNWILLTPEMTLLLAAALFLVMACLKPDPRRDYQLAVTMAAFSVAAGIACVTMSGDLFNHVYRVDLFSQVFKALLAIGFFLVVTLCDDFRGIAPTHHAEGYFLLAVCTLSMMMLASAVHLLAIVLALELSSYSLYILVFLRRDSRWGMITGLRYFLIGASASAIMLFGMALIYGVTGAVHIDMLIQRLPDMMDHPMVVTGLLLTLAGFFFKLAVFPFHFWAPEAYQGAPNQVAAFIAAVSKVAAVAILLRMISLAQGNSDMLARGLIAMAVVSMTVGNLAAIAQRDFKRLMAFSSVAHAGYLLLGMLCMTPDRLCRRHVLWGGGAGHEIHLFHGHDPCGRRRSQPADRRTGRPAPALAAVGPGPDDGPVQPGRHPAHHRVCRQADDFRGRHAKGLSGPGADRHGQRRHLPVLLPAGPQSRLPG